MKKDKKRISTAPSAAGTKTRKQKAVEPSASASEALLHGVLNAARESIWLFSTDGVLRMANETALKRFGRNAEEVIGKHVTDLLPPELAGTRLARLDEVVRTGKTVEFEDTRAGILFHHTFSPVFDAQGAVSDVAIFSRDITRQRTDEGRLANLASFPELNPNPIVEVNRDGAVTYANPAAYSTLARLGLRRDDIGAFIPPDLNGILQQWDRISTSTAIREIRIADRVFNAVTYCSPEFDVARIYVYDITESKRAEEALHQSEQRERQRAAELQSILDTAPMGIAIAHDAEGRHILGNLANERMFGLPQGAELSKNAPQPPGFRVFSAGRELPAAELPMQRAVRGETVTGQELDILRQDGKRITVYSNAVPLLDEGARPRGAVGAFLDITERKQAEEALREREARLAVFADATFEGIVESEKGIILDCNEQFAAMFGRTVQELRGSAIADLIAPEDRDRVLENIRDNRESVIEHAALRGDGTRISVEARGRTLSPGSGKRHTAVRDITKRRQTEAALRASEEKYRLLFESMGEGFALYELLYDDRGAPSDWRVLEVNEAYVRHTGVARERIAGRRISEVFPAAIPEFLPRFAGVVEKQQPVEFETHSRFVDRHLHVMVFPAGGHRFASTVLDITERRRAEEALRESEERMQQALRISRSFTFEWHPATDRVLRSESCADILRLSDDEAVHDTGQNFFTRIQPDDRGRFQQVLQSLSPSAQTYSTEYRVIRGDGSIAVLEEIAKASFDEGGHLARLTGVTTDITERKRAEEALKGTMAELERFNERMVGRELRMVELKREVNELCARLGQQAVYPAELMEHYSALNDPPEKEERP